MYKHLLLAALAACACAPAFAVEFVFDYPEVTGNANTGFDDPTSRTSDITGLPTTIGADRRACFEAAAGVWASHLAITVPVVVSATFGNLGGTASSALLGHAGPEQTFRDFSGAPQASTWYPVALANQLHGSDLFAGADITAEFNADVDNPVVLGSVSWYYGTDGTPPPGKIDLYSVAMHELGHGLGFLTLVGSDGALAGGFADIFARQLQDTNITPNNFVSMSAGQRITAILGDHLTWKGPAVVLAGGGPVKMYAPNPYESGSSTSHWDVSLIPNELMEPFASDAFTDIGLELPAFIDMGWPVDSVVEGAVDGASDPAAVSITVTGGSILEEGSPFNLAANVQNAVPTSYQWVKGSVDLPTETAPTLARASAAQSDKGTYRVRVVTDTSETITSDPVVIDVVPVGQLPVGGVLGLSAIATACAFAGGIRMRRRK